MYISMILPILSLIKLKKNYARKKNVRFESRAFPNGIKNEIT